MRKVAFTSLLLLSMLLANTGTAWAGSALELISVTNGGGGPAFTFRVSGEFSPGQLKGSGQVSGGEGFPLHCAQQDETTVICHAPKKISGQAVSVTFGGATFWTDVPQPQLGGGGGGVTQYCYSVWSNSYTGVKTPWADYGPLCQDVPPNHLDMLVFTFPGGINGGVAFLQSPVAGCWVDNGVAYYSDSAFC